MIEIHIGKPKARFHRFENWREVWIVHGNGMRGICRTIPSAHREWRNSVIHRMRKLFPNRYMNGPFVLVFYDGERVELT